jgi:hypothetical protein
VVIILYVLRDFSQKKGDFTAIKGGNDMTMKASEVGTPSDILPITRTLTALYVYTLIITAILVIVSAAGLLFPLRIYPTDTLQQSFIPNDVLNIVIGAPILLGSIWYARRGRLIGLLFWPGALMYVLYNYIPYVISSPVNWFFLIYLLLVILSAYAFIKLILSIDRVKVQQRLAGAVYERLAGGILFGLGALILLRTVSVLVPALINQSELSITELAVMIADGILSPIWIIGGVLIWQRKPIGYVSGMGLLFQGSMLFIALIAFLLLQPIISTVPFALVDVIVVFVMGMVCFIPFGLFIRGVISSR